MSTQEMPSFSTSNYAAASYTGESLTRGLALSNKKMSAARHWPGNIDGLFAGIAEQQQAAQAPQPQPQPKKREKKMAEPTLRYVRVMIADTDANLALEKRVVYKSEEFLTDQDDQELFFQVDIKKLLDAHNEERVKHINKKVTSRKEMLEPVRIRDLKMTVVEIASF